MIMENVRYFTISEFLYSETATKKHINNKPSAADYDQVYDNLRALAINVLDPIRDMVGAPVVITSGYRCHRLNQVVAGSATSQHLIGQAADFTVPDYNHKQLQNLYYKIADKLNYDQLIWYPRRNFIHVSYKSIKDNRHQAFVNSGK